MVETSKKFVNFLEESRKEFRSRLENSWKNKLDKTILLLYASIALCAFLSSLFGPELYLDFRQRCGAAGIGSLFLAAIYFFTLAGDVEETDN